MLSRRSAITAVAICALAPTVFIGCSNTGDDSLLGPSRLHQSADLTNAVSANRIGDNVVIQNASQRAVLFAVVDRQFAENGLADFCFGSAGCGSSLGAKASTTVAVSKIENVQPASKDALVFWWYADETPPPSGGTPATVTRIVVSLE